MSRAEFNKDHWSTPDEVVEYAKSLYGLNFVLDACATELNAKAPVYINESVDALRVDRWPVEGDGAHAVWCNPPYSDVMPWVDKAAEQAERYGTTTVMLLKFDTSTTWFERLYEVAQIISPIIGGRVQFVHPVTGERVMRWSEAKQKWIKVSNAFCSFYAVVGRKDRHQKPVFVPAFYSDIEKCRQRLIKH